MGPSWKAMEAGGQVIVEFGMAQVGSAQWKWATQRNLHRQHYPS